MYYCTFWLQARAQRHNPTFWLQARAQKHNCTFWLQAQAQKHNSTFWFQLQTQKLHLLVAGANTATVHFCNRREHNYCTQLYLLVTGASTDEAGFTHSIVPHQNTLDEFLNKDNQFLVIYSFRGFLKNRSPRNS
jgi:hypothetical protein